MGTTVVTLSTVASFFFIILFLYLLYIIGGVSQNVKRLVEKLHDIENKLNSKT